MKIVFINGSPRKDGNTAKLAKKLLANIEFTTLNLTDLLIGSYGQTLEGDQFDDVIKTITDNDVVVIGSPVYWHNICGSLRNVLDRFYGKVDQGQFKGKSLYFIFQGAAPESWMNEASEYTIKRFASLYGFEYKGMITSLGEAEQKML